MLAQQPSEELTEEERAALLRMKARDSLLDQEARASFVARGIWRFGNWIQALRCESWVEVALLVLALPHAHASSACPRQEVEVRLRTPARNAAGVMGSAEVVAERAHLVGQLYKLFSLMKMMLTSGLHTKFTVASKQCTNSQS